MVSVAKGLFSDYYCAVYRSEGEMNVYGYGYTEQEARDDLEKEMRNATRQSTESSDCTDC